MADSDWEDVKPAAASASDSDWEDVKPAQAPKKSWGMTAAEFAVPAIAGTAGALAGEAVFPAGGGIVGAGIGNLASDQILNWIRDAAGYKEEPIHPVTSFGVGAAGEAAGQAILPVLGAGARAAGRLLTGAPQASELAASTAGHEITDAIGANAERRAAEVAAPLTGGNTAGAALRHVETQDAGVKPVGRLFEKKGQEIGNKLRTVKDVMANTDALADHIPDIRTELQQNKMLTSPSVDHMIDELSIAGQAGHARMGELLGHLDNVQTALKTARKKGDRYALGELRDALINITTDADNIPPELAAELRPLKAEYRTLKDQVGDFYKMGDTRDPGQSGKFFVDREAEAQNKILAEQTPEEASRLSEGVADYITDNGNASSAERVKRFNQFRDANPEGAKKLFGENAFQRASTWGDAARVPGTAKRIMNDPHLRDATVKGWLEALKTPEGRTLTNEVEQIRRLPPNQQARVRDLLNSFHNQGFIKDFISGQKYFFARQALFAPAGVGLYAHHPAMALAALGVWGAREAGAKLIREHPEMYLKFIRAMASPSAQAARQAGYFAARGTMIDVARMLHQAMSGQVPQQ